MDNNYGDDAEALEADYQTAGRPFKHISPRPDALLIVLKSCKAGECQDPWKVLHPEGDIHTLADALVEKYDVFYETQPRISFTSCELGYIWDAEGPQHINVDDQEEQVSFRYQGPWHVWT